MEKINERLILLNRFFWKDRKIYEIGKRSGIDWFNRFEVKFARDTYAYFASDEKEEAKRKIATLIDNDEKFISILNEVGPDIIEIDRFVGEHYFYSSSEGFKIEDKQEEIKRDVENALKETGKRGYSFLKAIIDLRKEERWDKAYGGATWVDILAKIRQIGGSYPSPRDLALLKSYGIYFKTGSRRYPTHTIPEEMTPTVEEGLRKYEKK